MIREKVVELVRDVKNPAADRRSRDWNKAPVIKAGARFTVSSSGPDGYGHVRSSAGEYGWEPTRSPLGKLIVDNAKDVEPVSVRELMRVHDCDFSEREVLRMLLKLGRITAKDFADVGDAASADENF